MSVREPKGFITVINSGSSFWAVDPTSITPFNPAKPRQRTILGGPLINLGALQALLKSGNFDTDQLWLATDKCRRDLQNERWSTADVLNMLSNLVTGDGTQRRRTIRNASLNFVEGKQRLLRMPIQLSCADLTCPQQQTCRAGLCVAETIQDDEFEEFEEERVLPVQGRCFDRDTCAGGNPENIARFEIEDVVDLLQEDCTVPYLFPDRFEEDKAAAEVTNPEDARLAAIRGSINMGYVWSGDYNIANAGRNLGSATWTVVDKDPREGWEFANLSPSEAARSNPDATRRVVLAPGLCQALKADREAIQLARTKTPYVRPPTRLLGTIEKRGCAPKPVTQPECQP